MASTNRALIKQEMIGRADADEHIGIFAAHVTDICLREMPLFPIRLVDKTVGGGALDLV
jgi:hypothetical protein